MRFLLINTDYPEFLQWLYDCNPGLENEPYGRQLQVRNDSLFGLADFYSSHLQKLGHEAYDVHFNNEFLQRAWAQEHGLQVSSEGRWQFRWRKGLVPWLAKVNDRWAFEILAAQIKRYQPEVIINHDPTISSRFLKETNPKGSLLIGQHAASPLSKGLDPSCYDLCISSFPATVDYFLRIGIKAEPLRLAFEPRILSYLEDREPLFDLTFCGSLHKVHQTRIQLLEAICQKFPVKIWSDGLEKLPASSPLKKARMGQAWGLEMFRVLRQSKITLNHHGDIPPYANNMRLYEATGVGTLLITDWKENLPEMFEPGKEVVAYRSPEECRELIEYYLEHEAERAAIARAGQERTLVEHTYYRRIQELVGIIERYLKKGPVAA